MFGPFSFASANPAMADLRRCLLRPIGSEREQYGMSAIITMNRGQRAGFTLVEALLSSVIIAVCVMAVSAAFYGGFQNLRDEGRTLEMVNYVAGKTDELIATDFAAVASGSDTVTVRGESMPRNWTVELHDVDNDGLPDPDAKLVAVTVGEIRISTLVIDSAGLVTCKR